MSVPFSVGSSCNVQFIFVERSFNLSVTQDIGWFDDSVGWFSKVIDGVKASEGIASGLNGRIPQERNPEIILAGFTDWSKADVKSLGKDFVLSTVLTGFADTKLEHCVLYSLLKGPKTVLSNGHNKCVV